MNFTDQLGAYVEGSAGLACHKEDALKQGKKSVEDNGSLNDPQMHE
jgi:hypothetical protein